MRDQESTLATEASVPLVEPVGRFEQCVGGHYPAETEHWAAPEGTGVPPAAAHAALAVGI